MRNARDYERDLETAKKDLALLNVRYLKEKEAIDWFISDCLEQIKQIKEEGRIYYAS